jgi:hypothetical protein
VIVELRLVEFEGSDRGFKHRFKLSEGAELSSFFFLVVFNRFSDVIFELFEHSSDSFNRRLVKEHFWVHGHLS